MSRCATCGGKCVVFVPPSEDESGAFEPCPTCGDIDFETLPDLLRAAADHIDTLGDALRPTSLRYVPWGSINVITEPDGHESCNHGDHVECTREGHRTETLYRRADLPVQGEPGA